MVDFGVHHLPLPGGAPAPKKWGSLSPPASLSCGAPLRRARARHARRSLAFLVCSAGGNSVLSRLRYGVSGKSQTTTASPPPSEREALCVAGSLPCQISSPSSNGWKAI